MLTLGIQENIHLVLPALVKLLVQQLIFNLILFFERERESTRRGGAEGEREGENLKHAPWSLCGARSYNHEIMT